MIIRRIIIRMLSLRVCLLESIEWLKPDNELGELKRTALELNISYQKLLSAYKNGNITKLNDRDWSMLQNTDSWETTDMSYVKKYANEYGRDVDRLVNAFLQDEKMDAPIVLSIDDSMYLVAGNTRLMVARALGIIPYVWLIQYS